ncbi:hypothetical protein H4I96_07845 [Botrytis cinerea]
MRFKRETCSPTETTYQDKSNNNTVDCIGKSTAMADKDDDRPPKIPILDRKNWRQWFKMTKLHIVQKGWGYAITNNMAACRALHVNSGVAEFDEAIYKMEKAQAGAELFVIQHINDMDNELIEEITEFNAKWAKLEEKYKRVTPQELRNKFTRLTTWKLKDGVTAEEGWLEIYSIRKEIVEAEARQRDILTEDIVFGFFIQGLPERFNITIEAIDAQNLDFTTKFEKIRAVDETAALKKATALDSDGDTAMAMMAQSRGRQDRGGFDGNRRRSFDRRPRSSSRSKECFFCNESDHIARDCPHREGIKAYIKENPIKKSSSPPKNRTSSNWRNRESSPNSLSFRPARDRGYVAAEASDEDEVHHLPRPFPASFRKKRYFAEIICSWTRKTWIICLEKKSDIIIELEKWRIRVERESGFLVGATRTDNAPEIEKTSNCTFFEGSPGGKVDLKLRSVTSGGDFVEGQGIQNILPDRRPVGRPRIYPVASVRTMPIGTAEPEVATNVEESELEPITQLQSTTTPQVKWNMLGQ